MQARCFSELMSEIWGSQGFGVDPVMLISLPAQHHHQSFPTTHHPHKIKDQHCECKTGCGAYFPYFIVSDHSPSGKSQPYWEYGLLKWRWQNAGSQKALVLTLTDTLEALWRKTPSWQYPEWENSQIGKCPKGTLPKGALRILLELSLNLLSSLESGVAPANQTKKSQFMNFLQGRSGTKVQCESCLFSQGKAHQNSQEWAKFMNFSFWPFLWSGLLGRLLIEFHKNFTRVCWNFPRIVISYLNFHIVPVPFGRGPFRFFRQADVSGHHVRLQLLGWYDGQAQPCQDLCKCVAFIEPPREVFPENCR